MTLPALSLASLFLAPSALADAPKGTCLAGESAADCYQRGLDLINNPETSAQHDAILGLFEGACELGHGTGCFNAGIIPYNALYGFPGDKTGKRPLFERACELNDPQGCWVLGVMRYNGDDGPKGDFKTPLKKGCDLGAKDACEVLAKVSKPAPAPAAKSGGGTSVKVGSLTVDGLTVTDLDCMLSKGGMFASMQVASALAGGKDGMRACDKDGGVYAVRWTWSGGVITSPTVSGGSKSQNACVSKVLTGTSGNFQGTCSANVHL